MITVHLVYLRRFFRLSTSLQTANRIRSLSVSPSATASRAALSSASLTRSFQTRLSPRDVFSPRVGLGIVTPAFDALANYPIVSGPLNGFFPSSFFRLGKKTYSLFVSCK
jgi:hypothetical protein